MKPFRIQAVLADGTLATIRLRAASLTEAVAYVNREFEEVTPLGIWQGREHLFSDPLHLHGLIPSDVVPQDQIRDA